MSRSTSYFIVGGAGFIGSHFTDRLLADPQVQKLTIYDNYSSGRKWHHEHHLGDARFKAVRADVKNSDLLRQSMGGHDVVIHLASNPDIARAATEPEIDFNEGTLLTKNVVEAMRLSGCRHILYASGSGIYGDRGEAEISEDHGPLTPISTYGAGKLAGEAMISAYCHMFGLCGRVFRFGNVVGPRQTHGVGLDFVRALLADPSRLAVLGDGRQSKSYIHVDDVVEAVLHADVCCTDSYNAFNVATGDYITVREIAALAVECVGLAAADVVLEYSGGERGWKGDVPVVRLDTKRIRALGWRCRHLSGEALRRSMMSIIADIRSGRL